jgi:hypothetical protein
MRVDDGLTMTDASMLLNIYALQSCSNMGDVYRFRPDAVIAANEKAACERILGTSTFHAPHVLHMERRFQATQIVKLFS